MIDDPRTGAAGPPAAPPAGGTALARGPGLTTVLYVLALVAGIALAAGFTRFNTLHGEFLAANFSAVHGARTLLKARFFLAEAEGRLAAAQAAPHRGAGLLDQAAESIGLAESYGLEGVDADPTARHRLVAQTRALREAVDRLRSDPAGVTAAATTEVGRAARRLAAAYETAELDRWGTLSSLNAELAARMEQMRLFVAAIVAGFVLLMAVLGWALWRARRAGVALRRALDDGEAVQQTTLDASPVGILHVDHERERVLLANRQSAEIFGRSADDLTASGLAALFPDGAAYAAFRSGIGEELGRGAIARRELPMRRRTGDPFWAALTGKAIDRTAPLRNVVWICEDVSDRKAAEIELRAAREKAETANRVKSDFLANMSHEVRTPFTGILGVLELLARTPLSAEQARQVGIARQSAGQLLAIVNDVLDVSRIEAGHLDLLPADFDLRALLATTAALHETAARGKGLGFDLRLAIAGTPYLHGDPVRLRQIVDNLLANAVKFTDAGRIDLDVACSAPDASGLRRLEIVVADTGIGIDPALQEHVFEKFTQVDATTTRRFGGSGLGLAICRRLVEAMGGAISVDSAPGRGSRFRVELGLPAATAVPDADAGAPPAVPALGGRKILLADDAALNREVVAALLVPTGCEIRLAADGHEAVKVALDWRPDLILMDCQMPILDGYTAARRLRERSAAPPIVAITAHALPGNRERCLAAGMNDCLVKPVGARELFAALERHLPAPHAGAPLPRFDGRILLVDDDRNVRDACDGLLAAMGCSVVAVGDGRLALELAAREEFDLVLMDCQMPGMNGFDATRAWRAAEAGRPRTAIVAVTGRPFEEDWPRCAEAGMDDFLAKPFASDGLARLLERWLGRA